MNTFIGRFTGKSFCLGLFAATSMIALGAGTSLAQQPLYTNNNVTIDLSVLDDNGLGFSPNAPMASSGMPYSTSPRVMPPVSPPKSRLHELPPGIDISAISDHSETPSAKRIVLKEPNEVPKSRLHQDAPKQEIATAELAAPKPVKSKLTAPAEMMPKEPAPAPANMVEPVKAKPMAPKPVTMASAAPAPVTPPPAPKVEQAKSVEKPVAPKVSAPSMTEAKSEVAAKAPAPTSAPAPALTVTEAPKAIEPVKKISADIPAPPKVEIAPEKIESTLVQQAEETAKATATASLPGASPVAAGDVRIIFKENDSKLPTSFEKQLNDVAKSLESDSEKRVQLLAYAGGDQLSGSKARRLSLSRALAVRSYLIDQGIRSTRIDVRALGNKTAEAPLNRVDVSLK